jgi:hypothetical protein
LKLTRLFLVCAVLAVAAACSSGSSSVAPMPTSNAGAGQGSTPALNQTVNFTVDIPPAASSGNAARKRADGTSVYLSPDTGSISIRLVAVNGVSLSQPPPAGPAANVPATCQGSTSGCRVSVPNVVAAIGTDTYTVTTFVGASGTGAVISTGVISVAVGGSGAVGTIGGNPTELALGGYVASVTVTVTPQRFTFGVPGNATIVVTPRDAAGATIVGNAQFASPIILSVTGAGFTLSGPGLQADGTVQLIEPQAASPPIVLKYDGTGTSATVSATSQNASGGTVTAPVVTVAAPTPTPVPTSTAVTTLPPISPTPIGTGPTPVPTPAPSSFYVLNGFDNSIFEFSEPANGTVDEYPRRGFGGQTLACNTGYLLLGIATDPTANVYVGGPEGVFGSCAAHFYTFPAAFSGPGAPPSIVLHAPGATDEQDEAFELAFDAPNGGKLDYSDDSDTLDPPGVLIARMPTTGGAANPTLGYPVKPSAGEACFISPGMPRPDSTCGNGVGGYFDEGQNASVPFAVASDGSLYIVAFDETLFPDTPAILKVTPPNQISAGTITAAAAYIEGSQTMMSAPSALAFDAANNSLWVYDGGAASNSPSGASPPPIAGPGAYLLEFPLSAFGGSGAVNIAPTAFLSGQTNSRFGQPNQNFGTPPLLFEPNSIAVGDGKVFIANTLGPYDGVISTPPPQYNGEVDLYSDTVTGSQPNTVKPLAIYYGSTLRGPIDIAFGPHGTALGSGNLSQYPPNMPALRARFIAWQRHVALLARQRRALLRHR